MPWQPPERSPLVPLLLNNLLQQRSQEQSDAARAEARQKAINEQREYELASETAKFGSKALMQSAALYPNIPTEKLHALGTIGDLALKKQRDEKKAAEALDPAQLQALGQTAASRPDASGRLVPPPQLAQDAAQAALRERAAALSDPRDVTSLATQFAQFKGAAEAAGQEGISAERRAEATNIRSEGRGDFRAKRDALINAEANAIAYSKNGVVPIDESIEASVKRLIAGGLPESSARSAAAQAQMVASGLRPDIQADRESAQGKRGDVQTLEDLRDVYVKEYNMTPGPELDRDIRLSQNGNAVFNNFLANRGTPIFERVGSKKDAERRVARINDMFGADEAIKRMEDLWVEVEADRKSGKIAGGAFQGPTLFAGLTVAGMGTPSVAKFQNAAIDYSVQRAKMYNGAKSSDIDLKFSLLFVPSTYELGTEQGKQKLKMLRQMFETDVSAPLSKANQEKISRLNSQFRNAAPALDRAVRMAADEETRSGKISPETQKLLESESANFLNSPVADKMRDAARDAGMFHGEDSFERGSIAKDY